MELPIKRIAEVFSGIYVNSGLRGDDACYDVYYLQLRHWNDDRRWANAVEPELFVEDRLHKNYLLRGDVLLATKGSDNFAVLYDGLYQPAVASSVFTVLRITDENTIAPAYLQWFLNHPDTVKRLASASRGTSISLITKDVVENLVVPVPTLEKQDMIVHTNELHQRAVQLRNRINELTDTLFYHNLLKIAQQ